MTWNRLIKVLNTKKNCSTKRCFSKINGLFFRISAMKELREFLQIWPEVQNKYEAYFVWNKLFKQLFQLFFSSFTRELQSQHTFLTLKTLSTFFSETLELFRYLWMLNFLLIWLKIISTKFLFSQYFIIVCVSLKIDVAKLLCTVLTHFSPVPHFYTPWKRQKTFGFLTFSGGIEMWHWTKMG